MKMLKSKLFELKEKEQKDFWIFFENMLDTGRPGCYNNMRRGGQAVAGCKARRVWPGSSVG